MSATASAPARSKGGTIAAWIIQAVLACAFLAAASAKLAGVPMMVETFDHIGVGQWFRYVTALVEIAGAVALLTPGFASLGAVWLGVTMFFATIAHITALDSSPVGAVVLFGLCMVVLWLRRDEPAKLRARFL